MLIGFLAALGACFLWGLVFVIPDFLKEYSPLEVAIGRYVSFGILSLVLLFRKGISPLKKIPIKVWQTALLFGLISNLLYYVAVVIALRYATPPVTVLILGLCPIMVAFYGNLRAREIELKKLTIPGIWMALGLILVNVSEIDWHFSHFSFQNYLLGLGCAVAALLGWAWFAVHNAEFLKKNSNLSKGDWTTLLGVCTFVWALLSLGALGYSGNGNALNLSKLTHLSPSFLRFIGGITILGVVCSWLGCYLWNLASVRLPFSLMGPFIIFETIFGLFFVFLIDQRFPSVVEFLGIVSMFGGILLSIYFFRKKKAFSHNNLV